MNKSIRNDVNKLLLMVIVGLISAISIRLIYQREFVCLIICGFLAMIAFFGVVASIIELVADICDERKTILYENKQLRKENAMLERRYTASQALAQKYEKLVTEEMVS